MLFVTLTYPAHYPGDWRTWKRQLGAWFDRLRRRMPHAAAVWKLEPQKRGAPHFHLLLLGTPFLAKQWLSRTWFEVVASGDAQHLVAGTQIQQVRSHRGVAAYAAKYTAKAQHLPADWQDGVGRWWGVYNRARLGIEWTWVALSQPDFWRARRVLRALVASRDRRRSTRAPPRHQNAAWAVLADTHAARIKAWLDAPRLTPVIRFVLRTAAASPAGPQRSEGHAQRVDTAAALTPSTLGGCQTGTAAMCDRQPACTNVSVVQR